MYKFIAILLSLFLLNSATANEKTTLYDFRFWNSPERTRIVIDVDPGVRFSINNKNNKIILSIRNAKILKNTYKKLFYTDSRIKKTRIKRNRDTFKLIFSTEQKHLVKSYTLKPNNKYKHHRVVLDLYDKNKQTIKKDTPKALIKKLPSSSNKLKIIMIDAGHGGEDPGAIGRNHSKEKKHYLKNCQKISKTN